MAFDKVTVPPDSVNSAPLTTVTVPTVEFVLVKLPIEVVPEMLNPFATLIVAPEASTLLSARLPSCTSKTPDDVVEVIVVPVTTRSPLPVFVRVPAREMLLPLISNWLPAT